MLAHTYSWPDILVVLASVFAAAVAIAEFYGGPALNMRIQRALAVWWTRIDRVKPPEVGESEARFALRLLTGLFGRGGTERRLGSEILLMFVAFAVALFLWWEFPHRTARGFSSSDAWLDAVMQPISVYFFVSLAIFYTIWPIKLALRYAPLTRYSSVIFLVTIVGSVLIAEKALSLFLLVFSVAIEAIIYLLGNSIESAATVFTRFLNEFWQWLVGFGTSEDIHELLHVSTVIRSSTSISELASNLAALFLLFVRLVIAVAYLGWWLVGIGLKLISRTIFALFEADRGALTIMSAAFLAIAAALKWVFAP